MSWSTPADLRNQVQKLWDKGLMLAPLAGSEPVFPKRLTLKGPTSSELLDRFEDARRWSQDLRDMPRIRLEMREFTHRVFGANTLPAEAWIEDLDSAAKLIGKHTEVRQFSDLVAMTTTREPILLDWLAKRPLRALELSDSWSLLLDVVAWLFTHPRPGIYLRQMDIPSVHSKFVEANRGVLTELLDLVLPAETINQPVSGTTQFANRYGFLNKPLRIRFRILDPNCSPLAGIPAPDITLDIDSFAQLGRIANRVFITENETNFLAFPVVKDSLVIFGAGYGFEALGQARWLNECSIHYWGDIDTHGFAILDELRSHFNHVESFLMDRNTLLEFETMWGTEDKPTLRDLSWLTSEEEALYDELRDNRIRANLRLEQERIGFGYIKRKMKQYNAPSSDLSQQRI